MKDLVLALGLLFFIEGLLIAMFPSIIRKMRKMMEEMPTNKLRSAGVFFLFLGFLIVWYIKK